MTTWSKLPPRTPGVYHFQGARCPAYSPRIAIDEPVRLQWTHRGQDTELGVLMFGRQTRYRLEQFDGLWKRIDAA